MMRQFNIILINHCILQCRIETLMTEQVLDLLYRHTLIYRLLPMFCEIYVDAPWVYLNLSPSDAV